MRNGMTNEGELIIINDFCRSIKTFPYIHHELLILQFKCLSNYQLKSKLNQNHVVLLIIHLFILNIRLLMQ